MLAGISPGGPASALRDGDAREFSSREREQLLGGQLVVRSRVERRGRLELLGGTSFLLFDVPAEQVWRAVHDVPRWRYMLPQTDRSRQVGGRGDRATVLLHQSYSMISASYQLRARFDDSRRELGFRLDPARPGPLQAAWGFLRVRSFRGTKSIVTWGIMADPGAGVLSSFIRPMVHEWSLRVPLTMRGFIQGRGRRLYALPAGAPEAPAEGAASETAPEEP